MDLLTIPLSLILSGILVFLLRNWISVRIKDSIKHEYDCKLELVRTEARLANDVKLEKIKHELDLKLTEIEIKTNWLQKRMATEIETIYELLWDFRNQVSAYVTINQGAEYKDPKRVHNILDAYWKFYEKFNTKRIYFPKKTVLKIEEFTTALRKKSVDFHRKVVREKDLDLETDNWAEIDEYMNKDAKLLFELLEDNFRDLLGHYESGSRTEISDRV